MDINIHLTDNDLVNPNVRAAIVALGGMTSEVAFTAPMLPAVEPAAEIEQAAPQRSSRKSRKHETPVESEPTEPAPVLAENEQEPEATTADSQPPEEPDGPDEVAIADEAVTRTAVPSVVDLRAKAQEVGTTVERKKAIKALLDEIGSKSISEVPEDKRAEFYEKLDALGQEEE